MGVKTKNIQTIITIPKGYSKEERRMIASDIIDYMREQATSGHNPDNGDKYPKYEKAYAKFKGVKVGDVDLTLTGKMLEAMRLIKDSDGKLVIGYKKTVRDFINHSASAYKRFDPSCDSMLFTFS